VQEGHRPFPEGGPALMNNHFHSWTRFVCREGLNELETFDFESVKWLQLHLHGPAGTVRVGRPGILRRVYNFPRMPEISTSDTSLQQLFRASVNTILNNSQDTIVDGMGRERQQYSGDIGHIVHALHRGFGEAQLPARFLSTYSQGLTKDGFFLDAWPAYDRLNRLAQRQLDLTPWGPLLDHGVGFTFDAYYHYQYTGRAEDLEEVFPRLARFFRYLQSLRQPDGLLPVENLGIPTVWIDHDAYRHQRHKQLAFNAYVAAMLTEALAPLCGVFGQRALQEEVQEVAGQLVKRMRDTYWSSAEGMLINNLPWYKEEGSLRTCDRSLAHFILSGWTISPAERQRLVEELRTAPERMGLSYPPNAQWRHWALAEGGQVQPILDEYRTRWMQMASVAQNNTMQETWEVKPDSNSQWSHASVAPLYIAYMSLAGVAPLAPAYQKVRIRPQPGDLMQFSLVNHTPQGPLTVAWSGRKGRQRLRIDRPAGMEAELWLPEQEKPNLAAGAPTGIPGVRAWKLPDLPKWEGVLRYS
jgi:alpha-L-rhamnosidase